MCKRKIYSMAMFLKTFIFTLATCLGERCGPLTSCFHFHIPLVLHPLNVF